MIVDPPLLSRSWQGQGSCQAECQDRLGRNLHLLTVGKSVPAKTGSATRSRTDCGAFSSARDRPDDSASGRTHSGLNCGLLAASLTGISVHAAIQLISLAAVLDAGNPDRKFTAALDAPCPLDALNLECSRSTRRNNNTPIRHQRSLQRSTEGLAHGRLSGIDCVGGTYGDLFPC